MIMVIGLQEFSEWIVLSITGKIWTNPPRLYRGIMLLKGWGATFFRRLLRNTP
jgi:hypothetical protein